MNLLIVDDDLTSLKLLRTQLESEGHAVFEAHDGVDALALLERQPVDAMISDILMPRLDGYRLCHEIRKHARLYGLPVILYTSTYTSPGDEKLALNVGANKYLTKPASVETLVAALHEVITQPHIAPRAEALGEVAVLKEYNERLVSKLKKKNTELQAQTEALRASEERYRLLFERAPDVIFALAPTGAIASLNHAFETITGWPPAQWLGRLYQELIHPDDQTRAGELFQLVLGGERVPTFELRMRTVAGGFRDVEFTGFSSELSGGRIEVQGIGRDITERKQAAQELRESKQRLDGIVTSALDAIVTVDEEKRIVVANPAVEKMFGYTAAELHGQPLDLLMPERFRAEHSAHVAAFAKTGLTSRRMGALPPVSGLRKNGEEFPIEASISRHESTGRRFFTAILRDITQRKANEAKIMRLNRVYAVLSGINTTIVRVREEDELFREACRIAVELGRFTFAWIGKFDADRQQVTPIAQEGRGDGYLSQINLTAMADASGNCRLTAEAITQAKPVICNDIATDDRMKSFRSEALKRGYRSIVVLPLILDVQPVGVFVLYAPETDVFDKEEMRLLIEMADNISFALDYIQKEERLNYLAYFDAITGLPNRALFQDRVEQWIGTARRNRKVFSVIMLDLERFGSINESLGRQAGDSLLRQLAQRLKQELSETDILARLSADYFGIATRHDNEGADIAHALEKVLSGIQKQPFLIGGQELRVSARAGVSSYPADGKDIETLLRNAEAALKKAKLSGDKHLFYIPEFNAQVAEKLTLENKLRQALEQEQLVLHYQPKVNLKNGRICGLEALLRWNDPETGLVPPMKFIPLLEETGMILEAGRWALAKTVSDSLEWQSKGLRVPRIAVNVSPIQLQQKDFVGMVAHVISGAGNTAVKLELEITESLIMQDIEANIQKLRGIRKMGIEVAIDDFGTGYSSLSYIAKLPVNALKIDRAFIINMTSNSDDLSIVSTIISLAHSLNLRVIAEGVETEEQVNFLRLLKCNEIQGYLFSPAVPAERIEEFLREKKSLPR